MTAEEIEIFEKGLWNRIQILNSTIWENKILKTKVNNWLENYQNEEKLMALYLLSEFMYFGDMQMRILLKSLFRDLYRYPIVKDIRTKNQDVLDTDIIEKEFNNTLIKTRFIGIGNPSESGAHLLYFFRQENNLSKKNFINSFEWNTDENKDIERIVFLDDFCGSGMQVSRDKGLKQFVSEIQKSKPYVIIDYLMLVGTESGITTIEKTNFFNNVDAVIRLDESFKTFSANSRYFKHVNLPFVVEEVRDFARSYGYKLTEMLCLSDGCTDPLDLNMCASANSLGYGDCQLLLGFNHNTPDNTLPIIWYDEKDYNWSPIFKRYNKKYNF